MARPLGHGNTGRNDRKGLVSDIKRKAFAGQWNAISMSDVRVFKKFTGMTPKRWAKTYGWDQTKMMTKKLMSRTNYDLGIITRSTKIKTNKKDVNQYKKQKRKH